MFIINGGRLQSKARILLWALPALIQPSGQANHCHIRDPGFADFLVPPVAPTLQFPVVPIDRGKEPSNISGTNRNKEEETMNKPSITKAALIGLFSLMVLTGSQAMAQTEMESSYTWTVPEGGSTVVHYVVQHRVDNGEWTQIATTPTNTYTLNLSVAHAHEIRVAGVDAENRVGPFSVPSDPYIPDPGAPQQPGKPILF